MLKEIQRFLLYLLSFFNGHGNTVQIINLNEGINWISFNVDINNRTVNDVLYEVENLNNLQEFHVYSKISSTYFDTSSKQWTGSLVYLRTDNMYKIETNKQSNLTIIGNNIKNQCVNLKKGWNYAPYLYKNETHLLDLKGFTENDIIKSQSSHAIYKNNNWEGFLNKLEPGKGYMIYTNNIVNFCHNF
jgi:hypothetical protein